MENSNYNQNKSIWDKIYDKALKDPIYGNFIPLAAGVWLIIFFYEYIEKFLIKVDGCVPSEEIMILKDGATTIEVCHASPEAWATFFWAMGGLYALALLKFVISRVVEAWRAQAEALLQLSSILQNESEQHKKNT